MFLFSLFVILLTGCYFALKSAFKKKQKESRSLLISDKKDPEVNESIDITTCIPLLSYGEVIKDLIVEEGQQLNLNIPFVIVDGEFLITYGDKEVCIKIAVECVFYTLGVLTSCGYMKCTALKSQK
ncbi:hypothetical protein NBO_376g0003 [Nosema bombycis CQ1]|uniref:Uncharacterized protein n=1 Tax=Nosema bombycis (strain CQ1 / CVCC 102059) TaxID=578461 RepID=R0M3W0_NOSB1|nr:hypothetical protein NBO_376g0003 [Nosema bombycis CQ1]|eukprot:EOB12714.1 hypothetical protein NBO_376g0003 [Nosema bombycis CQ1]